MKPSQQPEDALNELLQRWTVDTPLPPRFQEQVRSRIARAERRTLPEFWTAFTRWLDAVLPKPRVAFSYMAALLILGIAGGSFAAQAKSSRFNAALGESYLRSVDPYHSQLPQP